MLFDLRSGKRRNVVRVVFASLAILMGGSLVLFGIGSDAPGGLLDAVGLGSSDAGSTDPVFDDDIENAQKRLAADPEDEQALLDLTRAYFQSAQSEANNAVAEGAQLIPPEVLDQFEQAIDTWERYLETEPKKPDSTMAQTILGAYQQTGTLADGIPTLELVAEELKSSQVYQQLALVYWSEGQIENGTAAFEKAIAEAPEDDRAQLRKDLVTYEQQAIDFKKAQEKAEEGQAPENPFGTGLGGDSAVPGGTGLTPPAP